MHKGTVVVTNCGARFGYNVAKSLIASGFRVLAAAPRLPTMCAWMKGLAGEVCIPDAFIDPRGYVAAVNAAAVAHGPLLMLPTHEDVFVAAEQRSAFSDQVSLVAPTLSGLLAVHDKFGLSRLAADEIIQTPETELLTSIDDVSNALAKWHCPVILKPRFGEGSKGIIRIDNEVSLVRKRTLVEKLPAQDYLLQKFTSGVGVGVGCLMKNGRLIASSQHIRLREVPISGGTSTARATFDRFELREVAASILRKAGIDGIAMLEYRYDRETDNFKLLDANPRYWGGLANHIESGVDYPPLHIAAHMQPDSLPDTLVLPTREIETRWILGEIRAVMELMISGRFNDIKPVFMKSTDYETIYEELSEGDFKPFIVQAKNYAQRVSIQGGKHDINQIKRQYFSNLFRKGSFPEVAS